MINLNNFQIRFFLPFAIILEKGITLIRTRQLILKVAEVFKLYDCANHEHNTGKLTTNELSETENNFKIDLKLSLKSKQ